MRRSHRQLRVEALDVLLTGKVVPLLRERDWELLAEVVRLAETDAPPNLAASDPALFQTWRSAVTRWHLKGWGSLSRDRIAAAMAGDASITSVPD